MLDLADAWAKLRWAHRHFAALGPEIAAFEREATHRVAIDFDAGQAKYTFRVKDLEPVSLEWGLLLGDCIHNARTALDYLMVRLWALHTDQRPGDVGGIAFPIAPVAVDPPTHDVDKAVVAARQHFRKQTARLRCIPSLSGCVKRIEELQPFNSADPTLWGAQGSPLRLSPIGILDNADKHRVPHIAWAGVNIRNNDVIGTLAGLAPETFECIAASTTWGPLVDGAVLGEVQFEAPLPSRWLPDEAAVKHCFPLHVSTGDAHPFNGILEVIPRCLWSVEAVLTLFEPVFQGHEPLSVATIKRPPSLG